MPLPQPHRLLISRTDAIGDVMLTLPLATILRHKFPNAIIGFLGKSYTKPVIDCCSAVDEFVEVGAFLDGNNRKLDWDTIIHVFPRNGIAWRAKNAGIPNRIGTSNRLYHWLTCNRLVKLSRKHSDLHEAQLNTKLLKPLGIDTEISKIELGKLYSFNKVSALPEELFALLDLSKRHIILHPKSQGSAREWGLKHFEQLVRLLPKERYQIFISGTAAERSQLAPLIDALNGEIVDIAGKMDLTTFISFIKSCDALVAASTGPLHIAAALGKSAIGLYPSIRPMHEGRWGPLGQASFAFHLPDDCTKCNNDPKNCSCLSNISPATVAEYIRLTLP